MTQPPGVILSQHGACIAAFCSRGIPRQMEVGMQILLVWLFAMLSNSQTSAAVPRLSASVLVKGIVDGDTIDVQGIGRVNLLGVQAPAAGRGAVSLAPFAATAKARLTSLLLNRWVRLESDPARSGAAKIGAAYVLTEDGQFINAVMVREGLARVSARTPIARLGELQRAERDAQESRRGIWSASDTPATGYTPPPARIPKRSR
jgi:micrococcal nuclease